MELRINRVRINHARPVLISHYYQSDNGCQLVVNGNTKTADMSATQICLTSLTRAKPKEKMEFPA